MKTYEQLTADVLARRDAYLAAKAEKRRQAKRYAAASLCVFAAVFAAAGLYRSGWLRDLPPVYPGGATNNGELGPVSREPSGADRASDGAEEDGTGTAETTTIPRAVNTTEQTAVVDLSGKTTYRHQSAEPVTEALSAKPEPASLPGREEPLPTANPNDAPTLPTREAPTERATAETTRPTEKEPETTTAGSGNSQSPPPAEPSAGPEREDPTLPPHGAEAENVICVLYQGGLYTAENAAVRRIPSGARALENKTALLYDDTLLVDEALLDLLHPGSSGAVAGSPPPGTSPSEPGGIVILEEPEVWTDCEPVSTSITLLALPGSSGRDRIGVTTEGIDGMFVLTYFGELEELLQEETP